MDINEIVSLLKDKGLSEEDVKAELEKFKAEIDAYLNGETAQEKPEGEAPKAEGETDAEKEHRVFGL